MQGRLFVSHDAQSAKRLDESAVILRNGPTQALHSSAPAFAAMTLIVLWPGSAIRCRSDGYQYELLKGE